MDTPLPASDLDRAALAVRDKVVAWRRDFHQHPELGNREFRTSRIVAEYPTNAPRAFQWFSYWW